MKIRHYLLILQTAVMAINLSIAKPPETKKEPVTDKINGFEITDYYRWLEDKSNPDVVAWSKAQHEYTVNSIKKMPEIAGLKDEIRAYLDRDIISAPSFRGNREFFTAKKKGEQQYKLYTRISGKEILLFDPEKIDPSGKSAISGIVYTEDGSRAAIGLQNKGNEITDYRIIDTKNGRVLGDVLKDVYGFSWTKDEKHAYITFRNQEIIKNQEPLKTYLYTIGEDFSKNVFMGAPTDAKNSFNIWDSDDDNVTFIKEGDFYSGSIKVKPTGSKQDFKLIYNSTKFDV
jgi:prolyl oligopeptidase